jgi:two-component sensor histidine kinase
LLTVKSGQRLTVSEETGLKASYSKMEHWLMQFAGNAENQPEILKFLFMAGLLLFYFFRFRSTERIVFTLQWATLLFILAVFISINSTLLFSWPSFSFFIAPGIACGLLLILHLGVGRYLMHKEVLREKQELREKLSRDLHDDLASTLGSISIYSGTLSNANKLPQIDIPKLSDKISALSQNAMQSISDIIWMTSPRNDSLQSLVSKIHVYLTEALNDNGIACQVKVGIPDKEIVLPEKSRNNLFLIMKESMHNVIKHSGADTVIFEALVHNSRCTLLIQDNGCGFRMDEEVQDKARGNGLANMKHRAKESGFDFDLLSEPGTGTRIRISLKI